MSVGQAHSRLASAAQKAREDSAAYREVERSRRELAEAKRTAYIHSVVAQAPPLSAEQRDRLALLLRSTR